MSSKSKIAQLFSGWLATVVFFGLLAGVWFNRQYIIDLVRFTQFEPSAAIASLSEDTTLTDQGKFYFYASQPVLATNKSFNHHCERKEADSPILGCYVNQQVYIFEVNDARLDGIEEVTAAHEMLHAVYERLSQSEKDQLSPLLEKAYEKNATKELKQRMAYYAKAEPGERENELHSILGTEFADLGNELEQYYSKYFTDRGAIVKMNTRVDGVFRKLAAQADILAAELNKLIDSINAGSTNYNRSIEALNADIVAFNARAEQSNGFSSEAQFNAERNALIAPSSQLESLRQQINAKVDKYESLRVKLQAVASESDSLNRSIDSTLDEAPKI